MFIKKKKYFDLMVIEYLQAIILGVSLAAPLGPVTVLMLEKVLKKDMRSAYVMSFSAIAGDFSWMVLSYLGISALLKSWNAMPYLNIAGIFILFYLGGHSVYEYFYYKQKQGTQTKNSFFWVYLLTVSNPFTMMLWLGIFGLHLDILYGLAILTGVALWFLTLPLLLNILPKAKRTETEKMISLISGIIIIGFALYFAVRF